MYSFFISRFSLNASKIALVTTIAVNIEASIPIDRVTAKPRTGPVPKMNRAMPAISVVTLESRIVINALLYRNR